MVETADILPMFQRSCDSNPAIAEAITNILHSSDLTSLSAMTRQGGSSLKTSEKRVKRPMNAFMLYAQVARRKVATKYPNLNYAKLSKTLGKIWQVLPEEERRPFIEEAERLRTQHKLEHPDYKYSPKRLKGKKHQLAKKQKFENLRPEELFSIIKNETNSDSLRMSNDLTSVTTNGQFMSSTTRNGAVHDQASLYANPAMFKHSLNNIDFNGVISNRPSCSEPSLTFDSDDKYYPPPKYNQNLYHQGFNFPVSPFGYLSNNLNRNHIPLSDYISSPKDDTSSLFTPLSNTFGDGLSYSKLVDPMDNITSSFI